MKEVFEMKKQTYEKPEAEIIWLDGEDVITASGDHITDDAIWETPKP